MDYFGYILNRRATARISSSIFIRDAVADIGKSRMNDTLINILMSARQIAATVASVASNLKSELETFLKIV